MFKDPLMPIDFDTQSISIYEEELAQIGLPDLPFVNATSNSRITILHISAILEYYLTRTISVRSGQSDFLCSKEQAELSMYVGEIALLYNDVNYHNLEHAMHVTMSMCKFIEVIRHASLNDKKCHNNSGGTTFASPGGSSVAKDSFIQFCLIFASFIHDVQHTGHSNAMLKERNHITYTRFPESSYAERHSMEIAMDILFQSKYDRIRNTIIPTMKDRISFGRILYTCLLSSDLSSQRTLEYCTLRFNTIQNYQRQKTEKHPNNDANAETNHDCSSSSNDSCECDKDASSSIHDDLSKKVDHKLCPIYPYHQDLVKFMRLHHEDDDIDNGTHNFMIDKVTHQYLWDCVLCETLMQVSDIVHLTQGWDEFITFNFRLFKELMTCYDEGLLPKCPSEVWNDNQVTFLTAHTIPLCKKMAFICGKEITGKVLRLEENTVHNMITWKCHGELLTNLFIVGYQNDESECSVTAKCRAAVN